MKLTNEKNISIVELKEEQKRFLLGYQPESTSFTSFEEMEKINKALELSEIERSELTPLRNSVVLFYREVEKTFGVDYFYSMLSVTAVIDEVIYKGHI